MIKSIMRRAPLRSQGASDTFLASLGDAATSRDLRGAIGCADMPLELLTLDDDFVVINKPIDVRMDGDFDVTVQKLIRHWCPTLVDKDLKWVHQLDFATSGVLCVALHRDAAARACHAFRERRAKKAYLAIVEGIVDTSGIRTREAGAVVGWGDEMEANIEKRPSEGRKGKAKGQTVEYDPPHVFFQRAKASISKAMKKGETLPDADMKIANASWAQVKRDPIASESFVRAAQEHREHMVTAAAEKVFRVAQGAPDRGIFRLPGDGENVFCVDASVSEIDGDFRMRVDTRPGEGGRSCRTKVEVLQTGVFRGQPVTKLLLRPHTGRRHQLRLHTLHIGHPILGDATYAGECATKPPRMCLHAHSLRLEMAPPLATGSRDSPAAEKGRLARRRLDSKGIFDFILEATAPDPFVFVDGHLRL